MASHCITKKAAPTLNNEKDRSQGCLVGLAVGDAVGTTLEFKRRDTYEHLTDMVGGGPFSLPVGAWTDDTSMALCLAVSLLESQGFNAKDQMQKYCHWWHDGYMSSTGECFDIGGTVSAALRRFETTGEPMSGETSSHSAGNGSLMRLSPVVQFYYPDKAQAIHYARESSRTTHGAPECLDACQIFAELLVRAIGGMAKSEIMANVEFYYSTDYVRRVASMDFTDMSREQVKGSGYVMESLEAALWCFQTTDNFKDAILLAANLGDDADTTAAICGQISGAYYGTSNIPTEWINKLVQKDEILAIAEGLYHASI